MTNNNIELNIRGMHCANCALGVEKSLQSLGCKEVIVDFSLNTASFVLDNPETLDSVIKAINDLGFKTTKSGTKQKEYFLFSLEAKFLCCLIFTLPLFAHMFIHSQLLHIPYVQLVLCLPVFLIGFFYFGKSAVSSIKTKTLNMDVLIIIGITASFLYSLIGTILNLGNDFLFYESSATITTIVLLGNLLEKQAVKRTTSAVEELTSLQDIKAKLISITDEQERITEINSRDIKSGDLLLVNTGDRIPADGKIYKGNASIDEAIITGESLPTEKNENDQVIGGTLVVSGSIRIEATAVGEKTVISEVIRLVKKAALNPPQIQRIGDKVSSVFVPVVLIISIITFLTWYLLISASFQQALLCAIAVLVISCPCAMGLATPTAVMVGIGKAAKHGILVKGGSTLEKLSQVGTIIFDKTGTLTTGKFNLKNITVVEHSREFIESILLGLEIHSSHPIAKSILASIEGKAKEFEKIEEMKGIGVKGIDKNGTIYEIGSVRNSGLESNHTDSNDLFIKENDKIIAWLEIKDEPRLNAALTISELKKQGFKTVLISGDSKNKCLDIGNLLRIDSIHYEKNPIEKLELIKTLEKSSSTAFVGDGINDAPSLAQSTVGISLSDATQIAMHSSQVVLLQAELKHLLTAIQISQETLRTIKQNLFWAFFYNVLAIPIAASGYLNPMIAALAMAFSDVIVIGNSLRMKIKEVGPLRLNPKTPFPCSLAAS